MIINDFSDIEFETIYKDQKQGDFVYWTCFSDSKEKYYLKNNKPYLVLALCEKEQNWVRIKDEKNNKSQFDFGTNTRQTIKVAKTIEEVEIGDIIYFQESSNYSSSKSGEIYKECDFATITNVKDNTLNFGIVCKELKCEYGVQFKDVYVLKTKKYKITDYTVDIGNTTIEERLELRQVMIDNYQIFDSILHVDEIKKEKYKDLSTLICNSNSGRWYGARYKDTKQTKIISYKDFIEKFKIKSDVEEKQIKKEERKDMPKLQDIVSQIFGSDYENKPKFLLTVYSPNGQEVATGTCESLDEIKKNVATDYRLIGHKVVVYQMSMEISTEVPVVVTNLCEEKTCEKEADKKEAESKLAAKKSK